MRGRERIPAGAGRLRLRLAASRLLTVSLRRYGSSALLARLVLARPWADAGIPSRPLGPALLLLAACSSLPPGDDGGVAGWHDGLPVSYADVCRHLRSRDPDAFWQSLEGCVLERVTLAEAEALGVRVPSAMLDERTERRIAEWEEGLQETARRHGGGPVDPAEWLERFAGISLEGFRASVRRHTEVELLQDRLLRYEQLASRRVVVSVVAPVGGKDAAAPALTLLEEDVDDEAVREALFGAAAGAVVGPFPADPSGGGSRSYRVEETLPAGDVAFADAAGAIEADLEERPVPMAEYDRWRRRILLRHGFAASPAPGEPG